MRRILSSLLNLIGGQSSEARTGGRWDCCGVLVISQRKFEVELQLFHFSKNTDFQQLRGRGGKKNMDSWYIILPQELTSSRNGNFVWVVSEFTTFLLNEIS